MVKTDFSTSWKKSVQPRKQRKYRYNAPLHTKQKSFHVHLSTELQKKYGTRNIQVKSGDKVKIMRGKFAKKEGKVDGVNLKREKLFVSGLETIKKDGLKIPISLNPSNVMIVELDLTDKKRKQKLEGTKKTETETSEPSNSKKESQSEPKSESKTNKKQNVEETQ